jgi:hypothetical protein
MPVRNKGGLSSLKIKVPRQRGTSRPSTPRVERMSDAPILGGTIQGKKSSAPEMVLARILDRYEKKYAFRYIIPVVQGSYGLRGEHEIDFLISDGQLKPVQVDDTTFVHHSPEQIESDHESDRVVNNFFSEYGGLPVVRIDANKLINESMGDFTAKQLGLV